MRTALAEQLYHARRRRVNAQAIDILAGATVEITALLATVAQIAAVQRAPYQNLIGQANIDDALAFRIAVTDAAANQVFEYVADEITDNSAGVVVPGLFGYDATSAALLTPLVDAAGAAITQRVYVENLDPDNAIVLRLVCEIPDLGDTLDQLASEYSYAPTIRMNVGSVTIQPGATEDITSIIPTLAELGGAQTCDVHLDPDATPGSILAGVTDINPGTQAECPYSVSNLYPNGIRGFGSDAAPLVVFGLLPQIGATGVMTDGTRLFATNHSVAEVEVGYVVNVPSLDWIS